MKAAIYNPYWDTLGGGEIYSFSFAKALLEKGYDVYIQTPDPTLPKKLKVRFGVDTNNIQIVKDIKKGDGYDLCFWLSDGSIPLLHSRFNILHFQFPFKNINGSSLFNKMKLYRINKVICNSEFTKYFIDREFKIKSSVLYPPVNIADIKSKRKENLILYVGRFSQLTQRKNQHILVDVFKKIYKKGYTDWKLVLAGGSEIGAYEYLKNIIRKSKGYPIEIIKSPDRNIITDLYGRAKIFWSAVGYGYDGLKDPMKVEHFGITLVESMAAGVTPLVYNSGGYREIVEDGHSGFLWDKKSQLLKKTLQVIENKKQLAGIGSAAKNAAKKFSYEVFEKNVYEIIGS